MHASESNIKSLCIMTSLLSLLSTKTSEYALIIILVLGTAFGLNEGSDIFTMNKVDNIRHKVK